MLETCFQSMSIHLHVIYRPPDGNLNLFLDEFTENTTRIADQSNIILTGHFNVHINDIQGYHLSPRTKSAFDIFNTQTKQHSGCSDK